MTDFRKNGLSIDQANLYDVRSEVKGQDLSRAFSFAVWAQKNAAWWIGDMVVQALERYGDDAFDMLEVPPHLVDACERWRAVAAKVPPENRREDVSWSAHAAVAGLPASEQRYVLARAADGVLNLREVQDLARKRKASIRADTHRRR